MTERKKLFYAKNFCFDPFLRKRASVKKISSRSTCTTRTSQAFILSSRNVRISLRDAFLLQSTVSPPPPPVAPLATAIVSSVYSICYIATQIRIKQNIFMQGNLIWQRVTFLVC